MPLFIQLLPRLARLPVRRCPATKFKLLSYPIALSTSHLSPKPSAASSYFTSAVSSQQQRQPASPPHLSPDPAPKAQERILTVPNVLTLSRIAACPLLASSIIHSDFHSATALLIYAGITDLLDGYLARVTQSNTTLGTILDPAADKILMTTLVVTLSYKSLLPLPLAVIILGRDVLLSLSAFYIRYTSLPPPKTFSRYWSPAVRSAEVRPTTISKINTALQLVLMGTTTIAPILPFDLISALPPLHWIVATTTLWSGLSYLFAKDGFKIISQSRKR